MFLAVGDRLCYILEHHLSNAGQNSARMVCQFPAMGAVFSEKTLADLGRVLRMKEYAE
jgi:hypothetical protein